MPLEPPTLCSQERAVLLFGLKLTFFPAADSRGCSRPESTTNLSPPSSAPVASLIFGVTVCLVFSQHAVKWISEDECDELASNIGMCFSESTVWSFHTDVLTQSSGTERFCASQLCRGLWAGVVKVVSLTKKTS